MCAGYPAPKQNLCVTWGGIHFIWFVFPAHCTDARWDWNLGGALNSVILLKPFLNNIWSTAECISCWKRTLFFGEYCSHEGMYLFWQCFGRCFPGRTLPRASHCLSQFAYLPSCILVPSYLQVNEKHARNRPHEIKWIVIHLTRPRSSIDSWCSYDAHLPIAHDYNGGLDAMCVLSPFCHSQHLLFQLRVLKNSSVGSDRTG